MRILAIDTSHQACSVALYDKGAVEVMHEIAPMQHTKLILPFIERLLSARALMPQALDLIAYSAGPGSFTGVRLATSVAQGLSLAGGVPLRPVSTLAIYAQATYRELGWKNILVALDARKGEIDWAAYQLNAQGIMQLLDAELHCFPQQIQLPASTEIWHGFGDGFEKYADLLHHQLGYLPEYIKELHYPTAQALLDLVLAVANKRNE